MQVLPCSSKAKADIVHGKNKFPFPHKVPLNVRFSSLNGKSVSYGPPEVAGLYLWVRNDGRFNPTEGLRLPTLTFKGHQMSTRDFAAFLPPLPQSLTIIFKFAFAYLPIQMAMYVCQCQRI